jgi:RNA polymerase sigma factor (sigma-70 family)
LSSANDTERFARVVEPHLADALNLALWLTANRSDAEDVVQEASLRAFKAIQSFSGGNSRAWVLAIVRNTAFTWLAKKRAQKFVGLDELSSGERDIIESGCGTDRSPVATPDEILISRANAASLKAAIAELPEHFREVLVLRDLQGLDYREIGTVTGVPLGTVMSRLARARQRLIRTLATQETTQENE